MNFSSIFEAAVGAHQCRLLLDRESIVGYAIGTDALVMLDEPIVFAPRVVWAAAISNGFRERSADLGKDADTGHSIIFYDATIAEPVEQLADDLTARQRRATAIKIGDMKDQINQERRLLNMYKRGMVINAT